MRDCVTVNRCVEITNEVLVACHVWACNFATSGSNVIVVMLGSFPTYYHQTHLTNTDPFDLGRVNHPASSLVNSLAPIPVHLSQPNVSALGMSTSKKSETSAQVVLPPSLHFSV